MTSKTLHNGRLVFRSSYGHQPRKIVNTHPIYNHSVLGSLASPLSRAQPYTRDTEHLVQIHQSVANP
jgi:hypothetical protein